MVSDEEKESSDGPTAVIGAPCPSTMEVNMDNKTIRGPADASRVNLSEAYKVEYWTKTLGVTKAQLASAIKTVGTSAERVRQHLKQRQAKAS